MAIRTIVREGEEVLRKKCRPVTVFDEKLHQLLDDMKETMYNADGVGLAAPQVGILRRVVVIDVGEGIIELINPKIVAKAGSQIDMEGCLSCPNKFADIERPRVVVVRAQNRNGEEIEMRGEDLLARAMCHEIDHLEGVLFVDLADEIITENPKKRRK